MHPVNKTDFGIHGIAVSYYNTTTSAVASGYIIKQTGTTKYVVSSDAGVHKQVISLAQTSSQVSAIGASHPEIGTIVITPFGNVATKATGTITIGAVVDGNPISVGGTAITFKTSGATGNQINILGTPALNAAALAAFLTASADTNITKATYANTVGSAVVTVTYKTGGTAGNAFALDPTGSGGHISVSAGNHLAGGAAAAVEHVRTLFDATAQTVEGHHYAWSKSTSVNGSSVIAVYS